MLSAVHNHTSFCDGQNTAEEMILAAMELGFDAIGFSSHAYTPLDPRYCVMDADAYLSSLARLKSKYRGKIEVYAGMEENAGACVPRGDFDYIIGSNHYFNTPKGVFPIDSSQGHFDRCLYGLFEGDTHALAESYYRTFAEYIITRRPDVVGHFDLITKFDEISVPHFLGDPVYHAIAEKYLKATLAADVIYEVNTGAISRGYRKTPYPYLDLLHIIRKAGGRVTVTGDCHSVKTLNSGFDEARALLREVGFTHTYDLFGGHFQKNPL